MVKYRIVTDRWCGYTVQMWRWWWPFWMTSCHTSFTKEEAEKFAIKHANKGRVIETLGYWSGRKDEPEVKQAKKKTRWFA